MQVVIEIDKNTYDFFCKNPISSLEIALKNGIIIPSEHGDLIDRDKLEDEFGIEDADIYAQDVIREMPVIIPRVK